MNFLKTSMSLLLWLQITCNAEPRQKRNSEGKELDVAAQRYCRLTCRKSMGVYFKNVACQCDQEYKGKGPNVTIFEDNLLEFRQGIVDQINIFRNKVASGETHYPKSANMMVMNYDVEMEFLCYCTLRKRAFQGPVCQRTPNVSELLQVPSFGNTKQKPDLRDAKQAVDHLVHTRFNQFEKLSENYMYGENPLIPHLGIARASKLRIGCSRALIPEAKEIKHRYLVYCLITSEGGYYDSIFHGRPLYKKGEPCTKCPDNVKCNSKYTSLCGELEPLPKYKWKFPEDNSTDDNGNGNSTSRTFSVRRISLGKISFAFSFVFFLNSY